MDIKEIKEKKADLETGLSALINKFTEETGVTVHTAVFHSPSRYGFYRLEIEINI